MEEFIKHLVELFSQQFPGSLAELEQARPLRKVGGYLIWDGFEDVEQLDRQRQLGRVLRANLNSSEQSKVTTILTLTPAEAAVMREG